MNYLTADESMYMHLRGVVQPVEVRDKEGTVLGHYTPVVSPELAAQHAKLRMLFDLEEVERIAGVEREGLPLAEVWKNIQAQEGSQ